MSYNAQQTRNNMLVKEKAQKKVVIDLNPIEASEFCCYNVLCSVFLFVCLFCFFLFCFITFNFVSFCLVFVVVVVFFFGGGAFFTNSATALLVP